MYKIFTFCTTILYWHCIMTTFTSVNASLAFGAVEQIQYRTGIAAIGIENNLRVYTQDVYGKLRESIYVFGQWSGGSDTGINCQGKLGSPLAAISQSLNEIRVYYLNTNNELQERRYSSNKGWYDGDLNKLKFAVAPYSKISAAYLAQTPNARIRVYAQAQDDTIQEYGIDSDAGGWMKMTNLGSAFPGSELATTSYLNQELHIRTYYQKLGLSLAEAAYDDSNGWYTGNFNVNSALPRASLAVVSFNVNNNGPSLRVYYATNDNKLLEKGYDGNGWYDGGFNQATIPGSEAAVMSTGSGGSLNLRVYFQNGAQGTGVSEWIYQGGWVKGVSAIPPGTSS